MKSKYDYNNSHFFQVTKYILIDIIKCTKFEKYENIILNTYGGFLTCQLELLFLVVQDVEKQL